MSVKSEAEEFEEFVAEKRRRSAGRRKSRAHQSRMKYRIQAVAPCDAERDPGDEEIRRNITYDGGGGDDIRKTKAVQETRMSRQQGTSRAASV